MISRENKTDNSSRTEVLLPLFESMQKMNQALEDENIALKKELIEIKSTLKSDINSIMEKLEAVKGNIS